MFKLLIVISYLTIVSPRTTFPFPNGRIIGGEDTDIKLHPWQVSLQDDDGHLCGGSLIDQSWVLTAGHCITLGYTGDLHIRAGSTMRSSGGEIIRIADIIVHEQWLTTGHDCDIALLLLESPVTNSVSKFVTLASSGEKVTAGANVTLTGWGVTGTELTPEVLQQVVVPVVDQTECRQAYIVDSVTDNMWCAGLLGIGGKDSCSGDSGGPAVIDDIQFGIVSWGHGCAEKSFPGVYTSVPALREWIKEHSGI